MRYADGRKKEAKQHYTPKAVTFLKKNELPWVGCTCTMYTCTCIYIANTNMYIMHS